MTNDSLIKTGLQYFEIGREDNTNARRWLVPKPGRVLNVLGLQGLLFFWLENFKGSQWPDLSAPGL